MQEHVILDCDALSGHAPISALEWGPSGQELYLMAITAGSQLLCWRHGAAGVPLSGPLSIQDWQIDHVTQLSSSPGRRNYACISIAHLLPLCLTRHAETTSVDILLPAPSMPFSLQHQRWCIFSCNHCTTHVTLLCSAKSR